MTNQGIVDTIDLCLRRRRVPADIREIILDAVFRLLNDRFGVDLGRKP